MNEFDIYTLGSGYYLEKIFNALRMIIDGKEGFVTIMKLACIGAIVALAVKGGITGDLKATAKWFLGVTLLVGMFLTSRATVHIHDRLPDSYGMMDAPRTVENVPWGLAFLGSTTSTIGNAVAEKFEMAFSGVFVNSEYQKTGVMFGSKIVEDTSKLRINDPALKQFMVSFYKKCIVPDARMGYKRKNGYTVKDLVEAEDLIGFLRERSSRARMIYYAGDMKIMGTKKGLFGDKTNVENKIVNEYISCNKAANYIGDIVDYEVNKRIPMLASSFLSFFYPGQSTVDKDQVFRSVLTSSYGIFLKKSSKDAKDILLQNVMINTLGDTVDSYSKAYGRVTTEEMTKSAFYSVSQMAQKFVPILRAVLECTFYGVFPMILLLMVTPIGLEVLKNYSFGFVYLQLWQPMYAILFCIAGAWGKDYASGSDVMTFASHLKISRINDEISAVAGYMLVMVPVLSLFITKGMVSSMGNLANSIFYIPQTAAVQQAQKGVEGNYSLGNTSVDNHSFNNTTGNKFDDNYSWMSGMKSFALPSGAQEKTYSDGRTGIDSSGAVNNLAGLAGVDWNKAIGSRYDQSINENMSLSERHSNSMVESASAGYSKLLGFDENFSQDSSSYKNWANSLNSDERMAIEDSRSTVNKFAESHGISQRDALNAVIAGSFGVSTEAGFFKGSSAISGNGSTEASKDEVFSKATEVGQDNRFANSLSKVKNISSSMDGREGNSISNSTLNSVKSDFNQFESASTDRNNAFERIESLQESKNSYEQHGSAIRQDLSHDFAEQGINKYGASRFEEIVRSNPALTNELLNEYLDSNIIGTQQMDISNEFYAQQGQLFDASELIDTQHQSNIGVIGRSFQKNITNVSSETPIDLEKNISEKIGQSKVSEASIEEGLAAKDTNLSLQSKAFDNRDANFKNRVIEKTNQSATGRFIEANNPFKNNEE